MNNSLKTNRPRLSPAKRTLFLVLALAVAGLAEQEPDDRQVRSEAGIHKDGFAWSWETHRFPLGALSGGTW